MGEKQRIALTLSAFLVVAMFVLSAWAWLLIPPDQPIPVHWGIDGQPDRYGSKAEAMLVTPLLAVLITAVFAFIPRLESRKENFAASSRAYAVMWVAVITFLGAVHVVLVSTALGTPIDVLVVMPAAVGLLFIVIGSELGHTKSNHFMGIRTPWTLSSELSWEYTHRFGGRAFMTEGALLLLAGLLRSEALLLAVLVVGTPLMIAILILYSYVTWKNDPNRSGATPR